MLQDLRAESYIGTTLWSHDGRPIGLIAAIGRQPLHNRQFAESALKPRQRQHLLVYGTNQDRQVGHGDCKLPGCRYHLPETRYARRRPASDFPKANEPVPIAVRVLVGTLEWCWPTPARIDESKTRGEGRAEQRRGVEVVLAPQIALRVLDPPRTATPPMLKSPPWSRSA